MSSLYWGGGGQAGHTICGFTRLSRGQESSPKTADNALPTVYEYLQGLFWKATFQSTGLQHILVHRVIPPQMKEAISYRNGHGTVCTGIAVG